MSRGRDVTGAGFAKEVERVKTLHGEARFAAIWEQVGQTAKLDTADQTIE